MKKGFTLIELIAVVAVISLLSVIAMPRFINATDSAKAAQVQSNISNLRTSINMFHAKTGEYPNIKQRNSSALDTIDVDGTHFTDFYSKHKLPETPAFINSKGEVVEGTNKVTQGSITDGKVVGFTGEGGWLLISDWDLDSSLNKGINRLKRQTMDIYANVISSNGEEDPFGQNINWSKL